MAENNLESHGTWQKLGQVEATFNVPGSIPEWREVVVDRARSNYETFKNHTAILFWSLGNESYAGSNIAAMNKLYKDHDSSRLTHYEGVFHAPEFKKEISDLESCMYLSPKEAEEYLQNPKKPLVECEYMHDMGNSDGGMGSYIKLIDNTLSTWAALSGTSSIRLCLCMIQSADRTYCITVATLMIVTPIMNSLATV